MLAIPRGIALVDELLELSRLNQLGRCEERAGQRVHPANVGVKQIDAVAALAPQLGVEIDAASADPPRPQDLVQRERHLLDAVRKLIGVPTVLGIAAVGVDAAEQVGFTPLKINVVLIRGQNDDEIEDFARITRERPWHVRFIELMPTGANLDLSANSYVSCAEALRRVRAIEELEAVDGPFGNGPATYYRFPGAPGTVGVITPMSHNYCDRCNRMRLTASGQLRPCLFGDIETDLRDPLRAGEDLRPLIEETLRIKPERHYLIQGSDVGSGGLVALSQTGG